MKDRDFLIWMHERLTNIHNESPLVDYMHKLRSIILATNSEVDTPNVVVLNGIGDLKKRISTDYKVIGDFKVNVG